MKNLLLISSLIITTCCSSFTPDGDTKATGYKPGDRAMNFALKNLEGGMTSLTDYEDAKGIILIFTCNHCPFSVAYEDRIIDLHAKYNDLGFPVVAVNSNDAESYPSDSYENMIERSVDKKFNFQYLHDETQDIAKRFGAVKTPHVFILKKNKNEFEVAYIGAIDDNSNEPENVKIKYVENALDEIIAGSKVTVPSTKAIGCAIKWKKQ